MLKFVNILFFIFGLLIVILPYGYQMIGLLLLFVAILLRLSHHRKLVGSILAIVFPIFLFLELPIINAAHTSVPRSVDYLILLGAGVNGTIPSLSLLDRLETTAEYMHANPDCKVIVTGGQGLGEDITEAEAMETYLINQNITADRIIKEEQATNTYENLAYSLKIIESETKKPRLRL